MKATLSLAWKEWHEVRVFLLIALGIFILLPIAGGIEALFQTPRRFEIVAYPWVLIFGGVLAIFVAVGATCRDFSGHLEDFWRSRPVSVTRWLLIKYVVGLSVVLLGCILPLALELAFNREKDAVLLIVWFPFLWAALYGIGFLTGCLVRRTAHAAMLALAAMLLVYFLPVVLPPLQWMNINVVTDRAISLDQRMSPRHDWPSVFGLSQLAFAVGMLGLAICVLLLALVAVHYDWRVGSGRKMMYGSISAVVLILFASAAFQLGTNMPILRQIDMPAGEEVWHIHYSGNNGYVISERPNSHSSTPTFYFRTVELTESGIQLGSPVSVDQRFLYDFGWNQQHAPSNPAIIYYVNDAGDYQKAVLSLNLAQLDKGIDKQILSLGHYDAYSDLGNLLYASGDRLYVIGPRLITLDITRPLAPRVISDVPFGYSFRWYRFGGDTFTEILPPVLGLSARQRFDAITKPLGYDHDTLCEEYEGILSVYRLTQLTTDKAVFKKVGEYKPTMLEKMIGTRNIFSSKLANGLLFVSDGYPGATTNPRIDVLDTRGPHPLRLIGHFAAPGVRTVFPLPDGNALVGGDKLWLIGPPPHFDQ